MHFIGQLSTRANNNKYILVITDYLTRYIIARPTVNRRTHTVTGILRNYVFSPFQVPKKILSDNAAELRANEMRDFASIYGIELAFSTPYHPHGNGLAKASAKKISRTLKLFCAEKDSTTWDIYLPDVVTFINSSYHFTLGENTFYALFEFDKRHHLNMPTKLQSLNEGLISVQRKHVKINQFLQEKILDHGIMESLRRNTNRKKLKLNVGDRVYAAKEVVYKADTKLDSNYFGPYKILKIKPPASYEIQNVISRRTRILHKDHLFLGGHILLDDRNEMNKFNQKNENRSGHRKIEPSDRVLRSQNLL